MSKLTKLADALLAKMAPKKEADAACIWIYRIYYNATQWCDYFDNCREQCHL